MKLILKILAILILAPIVLVLALVALAAAIVGVPLLWDQLVARLTAPPKNQG